MNTNETETNIILPIDQYFELIAKPEEEVQEFLKNPKNNIAFTNLEYTIQKAEELENGNGKDHEGGILPESANFILPRYYEKISELKEKENRTPREEILVTEYYNEMKTQEEQENNIIPMRTRTKEKNDYYRPTSKAGYIDATIILIMLLNIGFIVAMTILGNR